MNGKRPLYETQTHLDQEQGVAAVISSRWDCQPVKLPIKYSLDFALVRNKRIVSYCEMKTRNYTMNEINSMGGYLLSLNKWINAQNMCKSSGVPFTLIVQTVDKKIWYSVFKDDFSKLTTYMVGRKDRNDWQDIELCVLISANRFTLLKEITHDRC